METARGEVRQAPDWERVGSAGCEYTEYLLSDIDELRKILDWERRSDQSWVVTTLEKLIEAAEAGSVSEIHDLLRSDPGLVNQRDSQGATPLHYAAFGGHSDAVRLLLGHGAEINAIDGKFGATPAGWAIEYLRELGGFLGIELRDFAWAIERGDVDWVDRYLTRFPALRNACDVQGVPFRELAERTGNAKIVRRFGAEPAPKA